MNTQPAFKDNGYARNGKSGLHLTDSRLNVQVKAADHDSRSKHKDAGEETFIFKIQPGDNKVELHQADGNVLNKEGHFINVPTISENQLSADSSLFLQFKWAGLVFAGAIVFLMIGVIACLSGLSGVSWITLDIAKMLYLVGLVAGLLSLILADELRAVKNKD